MAFTIGSAFGGILLTSSAARAGTDVWVGGGSNDKWSTAANWSPHSPVSGDTVEFTGLPGTFTDLDTSVSVASIEFVPNSIDNDGTNYTIQSSASSVLSISSGISDTVPRSEFNEGDDIEAPIKLTENNTWSVSSASTLATDGTLVLNANLTTDGVGNTGEIIIRSDISGNGTLTDHSAVLFIEGASNTNTGGASVDANAALIVETTLGTGPVTNNGFLLYEEGSAGSTVIANNSGATLKFDETSTAASSKITNNSGGLVVFQATATATNATIVNSSTLGVDVSGMTTGLSIGSLSGTGPVYLGAQSLTVGGLNGNDTISGAIQDNGQSGGTGGSLTKTGTGTLTLTGANTYTGGTTVNGGGTLVVGDGASQSGSLGTGKLTVNNGSLVEYTAASSTNSATIAINGAENTQDSAVEFLGTSTAASSTIGLTAGAFLQFGGSSTAANATINSASVISVTGAGSLGSSAIFLTGSLGSLIFNGTTTAGAFATIVDNATPGLTATIDISQGNANISIGSLSGSGNIALGDHTLTLGAENLNDTISGVIQDHGIEPFSGGSLVKVGTGVLTLSGANTYTGTTTVNGGTLVIEGAGTYGTVTSNAAGAIVDIESGTVAMSRAINGGTVNINGGNVAIDASSGGTVNVMAGVIVGAVVGDPATINIYGGTFTNGITNLDPTQSIVDIFGSNFSLTDPTINGDDVDWTLDGTYETGQNFSTEYIVAGNDTLQAQGITFNGAASAPEPGALALLLPAGVAFGIGRVHRRRRAYSRRDPA